MKWCSIIFLLLAVYTYGQDTPPPVDSSGTDVIHQGFYLPFTSEAKFPGGQEALHHFIAENIHYPKAAEEDNAEGKVYVQFTIDTTGDIKDTKIMKGVHPAIDTEAIRVIEMMPCWIPAETSEGKVIMSFTLPLKFSLN